MIRLVYSNRIEALLDAFAEDLEESGRHPLEPFDLVVPNRTVESWIRFGVADRLGIAANLRCRRLERYVRELATTFDVGDAELRLVDARVLEGAVLTLLLDESFRRRENAAGLDRYLSDRDPAAEQLRVAALASRLAELFHEYTFFRPDMLSRWLAGEDVAGDAHHHVELWQRELWREIAGEGGLLVRHPPRHGGRWATVADLLESMRTHGAPPGGPVSFFGLWGTAPAYRHVIQALAERRDVRLYAVNPCAEFWEDLETEHELRARLRRHREEARLGEDPTVGEDPYGLFRGEENLLLRYWGRPGRENIMVLNEIAECDFEPRFVDPLHTEEPAEPTLLRVLQHDILVRQPQRAAPLREATELDLGRGDRHASIQILACPSRRREIEVVADEIWRLVGEDLDPPLRFSDIAVLVNRSVAEDHLPQIEAVFQEYRRIPHRLALLSLANRSRVLEAIDHLISLPLSDFTRSDLLKALIHPLVCPSAPHSDADVDVHTWPRLAERLGIVAGSSRHDLLGTYVTEDLLSWDQGLTRLVLGAFMAPSEGDRMPVVSLGGDEYLPAESPPAHLVSAGRFGLLARSLMADALELRDVRLSFRDWAERLRRFVTGYVQPGDGEEESEMARVLDRIEHGFGRRHLTATPVGFRVASEALRRELRELTGKRGTSPRGVTVAPFLPMRATPYRAVFVLGLDSGSFPVTSRRDAIDLRGVRRFAGDVTPSEQDRYTCLETLLATRDRLYLSYVARDEATGETLPPSGVVEQLREILAGEYLGVDLAHHLVREFPQRRYDERYFSRPGDDGSVRPLPTVSREAAHEARAHAIGATLSEVAPDVDGAPLTILERIEDSLPPGSRERFDRFFVRPRPAWRQDSQLTLAEPPPELSMAAIRGFLESPLQGAARTVVGLDEDERDALTLDEEVWEASPLHRIVLLRHTVIEIAAAGGDAERTEETYRRLARRLQLAGDFPVGVLGEVQTSQDLDLLRTWIERLREHPDWPRLGRLIVGRGHESGGSPDDPLSAPEAMLPPVAVTHHRSGRSVDLWGTTQVMLGDRDLLVLSASTSGRNKRSDERFRYALRGVLDHLALAALGHERTRTLWLLQHPEISAAPIAWTLRPVESSEAIAYLSTLVGELLDSAHDYLLPCEAVYRAWDDAGRDLDALSPDGLRRQIESGMTSPYLPSSSRWGPIDEPETFGPLCGEAAVATVRRRFGLILELLDEGEPT